jgi:hypothetical protein
MFLLCCDFVSLCSPRIVETRGRWATHRNFGLSMQPGGYVHDYVMNVFAATVMEEQYDNSVLFNQQRPQCLKYIMYSESVVSFYSFFLFIKYGYFLLFLWIIVWQNGKMCFLFSLLC